MSSSGAQSNILSWASKGDGQFRRLPSQFRSKIEQGGEHPPEKGRYTLYVSLACPCEPLWSGVYVLPPSDILSYSTV